MRYVVVLFTAFVLSACSTTPRRTESPANPSQDAVVEFLLTSSAKDFKTHGPAGPLRFREVRMGHFKDDTGEDQYLLCGQYLPTKISDPEWVTFATIKTSGYEQWNGSQADAFCQRPSVVWDNGGDLSSSLQSRFDSMP